MSRPFVYSNMAITADGKITSSAREEQTFTSRADKEHMDTLRAQADAIVVGAGSVRADDPPMHLRDDDAKGRRRALGKPEEMIVVLVTGSGQVDPKARIFSNAGTIPIVATTEAANTHALDGVAEVWRLGATRVDVAALLRKLGERGVERVLLEGGSNLNWSFLVADLIDELHVTVAPALLGGSDAPGMIGGAGLAMTDHRRLELTEVDRRGDELYLTYRVVRS